MLEVLPSGISLLEIGCGTGDFLFQAAPKLSYGLGIDADARLIRYAQGRKQQESLVHLHFKAKHIDSSFKMEKTFDWGVASFFFHVLPPHESAAVLASIKHHCDQLLIAAFVQPSNRKEEWLMWLDQRWSGHYSHYREYARQGYMDGLLERAGLPVFKRETSFDPCIVLYFL